MRLAARRCRSRGTGNGGCARGALKRCAHRDLGRSSPRCSRPARASPRTASSRGIHGDGAGRCAREVSATSPGGVHVGATVTLVQVARSVSCPELGAGRRFRTWCARLQHEKDDDHDHHDDEREDRDVTGAHGNQRIPHRAGASTRIWRPGAVDGVERSEPPGGALDGHGPAELRAAGHVSGVDGTFSNQSVGRAMDIGAVDGEVCRGTRTGRCAPGA
jgi:hypothetical protein